MPVAKTTTQQALSIQNLAKQLNVSLRTAHRLIASGDLRAYRIGRQWRVLEPDLQEYLARHVNHDAADRGNHQPTVLKPADLGTQIEEIVVGGETEASIKPRKARSTGREPMTIDQLNAALAERVMGWRVSPERFLIGGRSWTPRWQFQPLRRLDQALQLLNKANGQYTLTIAGNGTYSARVSVGARDGHAVGTCKAAVITMALARALGIAVEEHC
jgi:excisionase family DNA binding protein